ncbi:MAG: hypothetical protein M0Z53_08075 [Thermaerobacter sp.]|nr:hypothetical protein [Thermaerobacter sp.]
MIEGASDPLCPRCTARNVGRVGTGQYYCWDCFIEFSISHRGIRMYQVEADGELSRIDTPVAGVQCPSDMPSGWEGVVS